MRIRLWQAAALTVGMALVWATAAGATPSTLVWIPSTDIQADGTWHWGLDTYFTPRASGQETGVDVGLTYGFARGRGEVGVDYVTPNAERLFFNAKYLLRGETGSGPALAAGLMNWGTQRGVTDYNMVYLLGAKTVGPVRLTLGYCHGKESTLGRDPDMLLAGVDGYLDTTRKWWGAIDYQSGKHAFGAVSAGVARAVADNVSVLIGYDWYNSGALEDTVTVQVDVNF